MWDWLKDAGGQMMQAGAEYLEHRAFILSLFQMSQEQAYWALKQKVDAMDEATVQRFYQTIVQLINEAQVAVEQAQSQASWGNTFEDRTAQFMAQANAGFPGDPAVQQAQMFLQGLTVAAQLVQQFYQERAPQPPPAVQPAPSEPPPARPMDDMEKVQQYMLLQQRHMQAMPNIMPGKASQAVVDEFLSIYAGYEALLQAGPPEFEFYTAQTVHGNMADVLDKLARTWDSLRDEDKALDYYERAAAAFDRAGQPAQAAETRANIAKIRASRTGDIDGELLRLQSELATATPGSLPSITKVVELGELYMKAGDDFAAEAELEKAMAQLEQAGYPEPDPRNTLDLLRAAVDAPAEVQLERLRQVEQLETVRGLYQRIYHSLALIYQETEDLEAARRWLQKYQQLSGNTISEDDIASMLDSLQDEGGSGG